MIKLKMAKKKDEVKEAPKASKKKAILPLALDTFGREDMNGLRDKINELVEAHNCDCK